MDRLDPLPPRQEESVVQDLCAGLAQAIFCLSASYLLMGLMT